MKMRFKVCGLSDDELNAWIAEYIEDFAWYKDTDLFDDATRFLAAPDADIAFGPASGDEPVQIKPDALPKYTDTCALSRQALLKMVMRGDDVAHAVGQELIEQTRVYRYTEDQTVNIALHDPRQVCEALWHAREIIEKMQ